MKNSTETPVLKLPLPLVVFCFLTGIAGIILLSPKWPVSFMAWLSPLAFVLLFRYSGIKKPALLLFPFMVFAFWISFKKVVPMPEPVVFIFALIHSLFYVLPFIADKWAARHIKGFSKTLIFPSMTVLIEWLLSYGPWGLWGSLVNTQWAFPWILQLASITGSWGILFLISWFASSTGELIGHIALKKQLTREFIFYPVVLLIVLVFGCIRYSFTPQKLNKSIAIGGVSVSNYAILESLYQDATGKQLHIKDDVYPGAPIMQEANQGLVRFIQEPDTRIFSSTLKKLNQLEDSLFHYSLLAVQHGAGIVSWNEGAFICWKDREQEIINRGIRFSANTGADLVMGLAVFHTGPIQPGKPFIENKLIYINAKGKTWYTFNKNKPVPGIEPSIPGDGKIPAIPDYGTLVGLSICYDADFPTLISQAGNQHNGLLIIPSGDWQAVSPYHGRAAALRAIENGLSIFRPASGGSSMAFDQYGHTLGELDFSSTQNQYWIARVPVQPVFTIYPFIPGLVPALCGVIILLYLFSRIRAYILNKKTIRKLSGDKYYSGNQPVIY